MTKREKPSERTPRVALTKAERVACYDAAAGRCYVFGTELRELGEWSVIEEGGTRYLLSPEAKKLKAGRTMEELRKHIADSFREACDAVDKSMAAAKAAKDRQNEMHRAYRDLLGGGDIVVFAGERKAEAVEA